MNQSVLVTGTSGSGKTVALQRMECSLAEQGIPILVLNFHGTHAKNQIYPPLQEHYEMLTDRVDVKSNGISLNLLAPITHPDGSGECCEEVANAVVEAFDDVFSLGYRQRSVLRNAILWGMANRKGISNDIEVIEWGLKMQDSSEAEKVLEKFWGIFYSGIFRSTGQFLRSGRITILELESFDVRTQRLMAELVLSSIWRYAVVAGQYAKVPVYIVIDEFQNLSLTSNSILTSYLREGRKYNLALLLSTQTLEVFGKEKKALLQQVAVRCYFRPASAELSVVAKEIDKAQYKLWFEKLAGLGKGVFIAAGRFEVEGCIVEKPLILRDEVGGNG